MSNGESIVEAVCSSSGRLVRQRRTQEDWRCLLDQWAGSGETVRVFCRRQRVNVCQFYAWRRRLQAATERLPVTSAVPNGTDGGFVEAVVVEGTVSGADAGLEVVLGNQRRIRVTGEFDEALLRKLVRNLEAI